jgi:hypothetical protein
VLITEPPDGAPARTWRAPLTTRMILAAVMAVIVALPAAYAGLTLWTNQVSHAPWITLALWLAAWAALAVRVLAQSVTLTPDTLVIRNIFTTERVPLAEVTGVGFNRRRLTVTTQRGTFAPEQHKIGMPALGTSYWSGRRSEADDVADAIASAAGLPALPPRPERISSDRARLVLVAAPVIFAAGLYLGPLGLLHPRRHSFAVTEFGVLLFLLGIQAFGFGLRVTLDHRHIRDAQLRP